MRFAPDCFGITRQFDEKNPTHTCTLYFTGGGHDKFYRVSIYPDIGPARRFYLISEWGRRSSIDAPTEIKIQAVGLEGNHSGMIRDGIALLIGKLNKGYTHQLNGHPGTGCSYTVSRTFESEGLTLPNFADPNNAFLKGAMEGIRRSVVEGGMTVKDAQERLVELAGMAGAEQVEGLQEKVMEAIAQAALPVKRKRLLEL